ncbi:Proteoglycan 4 protein [Rutstroemia sp. NJR-2017a BBW]|nr:Proteoglycan 4 protein [Rutstroemia sp. NJR-2017a BBW]
MRHSFVALAALSLWQGVTAQTETLIPYHPKDLGLQRRDAPSTVTLQDELSLIWGSSNGSTFVNVTLNTGETELVISTEYFADDLAEVQCDGDLVLRFKNNATFQEAIADWSWVNFAENRTFFMINNWGDCASNAESGRQPWIVRNVDQYDQENFIVNFNATLSSWDIVAANSVIEFGAMPSSVSKRDDTLEKSFGISLAHALPQVLFSKTTNSGLDFSISCPNCATTGQINVVGKIVLSTFLKIPTGVKSISISATPQGVGATLALGFDVSGTLGSGWEKDWNLITTGLPGWQIPGILVVGPQFSVDAHFGLSGIHGSASISAGINVAIPDSSSAVLGISGVDSSSNGWVPTITPIEPKVSVEVDGQLEMYVEMGVDIGLTILGKWGFGGGVYLRVPDVKIDLGAEFNTQGACPGSADVFGVTFDCTVGVNLGLGVYTESSGTKDWKANHTIYQNDALIKPINKCFPLGPTLAAAASGVPVKTVGTVPVSSSTSAAPSSTLISVTQVSSGVVLSTTVSSSKVSGSGVSSSARASGSTKVSGSGASSTITSKQTSTPGSSIHSYGSGSSSTRSSSARVSSVHSYGAGASSSSTKVRQSGSSSAIKSIVTSGSVVPSSGASTTKKSSSSSTEEVYGHSSATTSVKSTITSSVSASKVSATSGSVASSAVLGISVSASATASTTAKAHVASSASSSAVKSSSTSKVVASTVSGSAPAPTATGTISTCNKWVVIEDAECSCPNIENQYGVTAVQLLTWNPAIGADCKLVIGNAVCIGVKAGYAKRSVNGRLARFVDA